MDQALLRLPKCKHLSPRNHLLDKSSQAGYREGITAGKESALQEGFDAGFAKTGGPIGRELGLLRGVANALLLHLSQSPSRTRTRTRTQHQKSDENPQHAELPRDESKATSSSATKHVLLLQEIVDALAAVRFADIVPPPLDEETEGHARCAADLKSGTDDDDDDDDDGGKEGEEAGPRSAGLGSVATTTTTIDDVRALRVKLENLLRESGLKVDLNLEIF